MAKVRMLETAADGKNLFLAGDTYTVTDAVAREWIFSSVAELVDDSSIRCCTKSIPCKAVRKGAELK